MSFKINGLFCPFEHVARFLYINTKLIFRCPNILGILNESLLWTGAGACPYE